MVCKDRLCARSFGDGTERRQPRHIQAAAEDLPPALRRIPLCFRISTHGATLLSWTNTAGRELLFVSSKAVLDGSKAIRGGVPVCFPQVDHRSGRSSRELGGAGAADSELRQGSEQARPPVCSPPGRGRAADWRAAAACQGALTRC